ncbi:MAG: solute carrier family 23 protein [Enterocloster sp.]
MALRLPVVMGVSFTFVTVLSTIAANYGYPAVVGAVLIGGIFEGTLGLLAKYWRRIITPVVAGLCGNSHRIFPFSQWAPGPLAAVYADDFGSAQNLILGTRRHFCTCLLWNIFAKGYFKAAVRTGWADCGLCNCHFPWARWI